MADVPEPITRLEKYWAAILEKIQGGGSSVTVEPLTVTENGTTTAPSGKAYSPVTVAVPNPNSVVTINGTLDNPFGDWSAADFSQFIDDVTNSRVTARITVDGTVLGAGTFMLNTGPGNIFNVDGGDVLSFEVLFAPSDTLRTWNAMSAWYFENQDGINRGTVVTLAGETVSDVSAYASLLSTTLTVIYHPLPTE